MSLFSGLYVGSSGIQTSSNALNTVAHNISNVDTTGYTRQQVSQSTRPYDILSKSGTYIAYQEVGMGVKYAEVRQVRDFFLDKTYRREYGRQAFYDTSYKALLYMEDIIGETGEDSFQKGITDLWTSIQELAKEPDSPVTQGLLVSRSQTLIERAQNVYQSMKDYQNNLNADVKRLTDTLNKYGERLKELNKAIAKIECGEIEHANDLRDERNHILDEMAKICKISYSEDIDTHVTVQIEGVDFVKRDDFYPIGLDEDERGFYTPFWPQNSKYTLTPEGQKKYDIKNSKVFDMTREISSAINTDVGELKSVMLARGDHYATSEDLKDKETYNRDIAQSICMNVEAEFDNLITNIVTQINKILKTAGYTDGTGNVDDCLFIRKGIVGMTPTEGWHIGNIEVNSNYIQTPTLLKMKKVDESVDFDTATELKKAFELEDYTLNPNMEKKTRFIDYYTDMINQVANSGNVFKVISDTQFNTVESAAAAREQVVGVSSDEELQFMIMYQNAYNASSRYMTTINDMLENLLNAFGA